MKPLVFALVGHPVAHSLSPRLHGGAFAALGLPHSYVLRDCPDLAALADAVGAMRHGDLHGLNVTIPHKSAVLEFVDSVHGSAAQVGAANVLVKQGSAVVAYNTDAIALAERIRLHSLEPGAALVLGAGGAARAAATALAEVGMQPIFVAARGFRSESAREGFGLDCATPVAPEALPGTVAGKALAVVVQATSAGMVGKDPAQDVISWVPWAQLRPNALALDVVYVPEITEFMAKAARHGCRTEGGTPMLVSQAAHALRLWLGVEPPREAMVRALSEDP